MAHANTMRSYLEKDIESLKKTKELLSGDANALDELVRIEKDLTEKYEDLLRRAKILETEDLTEDESAGKFAELEEERLEAEVEFHEAEMSLLRKAVLRAQDKITEKENQKSELERKLSYLLKQNDRLEAGKKIYPNDPCPCGSGKKYKKCCGSPGRDLNRAVETMINDTRVC